MIRTPELTNVSRLFVQHHSVAGSENLGCTVLQVCGLSAQLLVDSVEKQHATASFCGLMGGYPAANGAIARL